MVDALEIHDSYSIAALIQLEEILGRDAVKMTEGNDFYFNSSKPLNVSGGLNDTVGSGSLVPGFDNGLVGMAKGQTSTITVIPSQGYGLFAYLQNSPAKQGC